MRKNNNIRRIVTFLIFVSVLLIAVLMHTERAEARFGGGHNFNGKSIKNTFDFSLSGGKNKVHVGSPESSEQAKKESDELMLLLWEHVKRYLFIYALLLIFHIITVYWIILDNKDYWKLDCFEAWDSLGCYIVGDILLLPITIFITLPWFFTKLYYKFSNQEATPIREAYVPDYEFEELMDFSNICEHDPAFRRKFTDKVEKAFVILQNNWSNRNLDKNSNFLADGIYEKIKLQIDAMVREHELDIMKDIFIDRTYITKIETGSNYDSMYVVIDGTAINYRIDDRTKKVKDGNPKKHERFTEIWCFMRRVGAKTLNRKGLLEGHCPNCGTSIEGSRLSICPTCNSFLLSGQHDWVLTSITQASQWKRNHNIRVRGLRAILSKDPYFNIQNIEDRISGMFWRMVEATKTKKSDYIKKISTDSFIDKFVNQPELITFPVVTKPTIGSIDIIGIIASYSGYSTILIKVVWSGSEQIINSIFVIKRSEQAQTNINQFFSSFHCPNCGAPETQNQKNTCEYCNTVVNDLNKDWMLDNVCDLDNPEIDKLLALVRKSEFAPKSADKPYQVKGMSTGDIARMIIAMTIVDGVIDSREKTVVQKICRDNSITNTEFMRHFEDLKKMKEPINVIDNISITSSDTTIVRMLVDLAAADDIVTQKELDILDRIAFKVGAPSLFVDKLLYAAKKGNEKLQYPERPIIPYIDPWD